MEKDGKINGCCKEVKLKVKNDNDQFKSFVSILFEKIEPQHVQGLYAYKPELKIVFSQKYVANHGPPNLLPTPLFILNRVILI